MNQSPLIQSEFSEKLFHENEVRHNKHAAIAVLVLACVHVILSIVCWLGIHEFMAFYIGNTLIVNAAFNFFVFFYCRHFHYDHKYAKSLLLTAIILTAGVEFFFYPLNSTFIGYGPIIISTLYFNPKLTKRVAIGSWITCTVLIWLNVILDTLSPQIHALHLSQMVTVWEYPLEIFLYRFLPHTILLFICGFVCIQISKSGRRLIIKNAEEARAAASVSAELATASRIQRSYLPASHFADENVRIETFVRPMKAVGGDFYDYFYLDSQIVVLIADVSDKGLPAAMFMMKAKNALWSEISSGKSLKEAAQSVNRLLTYENHEDMFVTAWIASIDVHTGIGRYVNCGHLFPIIRHRNGSITEIENKPQLVLGLFEDATYASGVLRLLPGDMLVLYTDGFTDAVNKNKESFGLDRFKSVVSKYAQEEICAQAITDIDAFSEGHEQFDDMTMLTLSLNFGETKVDTAKSLFGILPNDISLEDSKKDRLETL